MDITENILAKYVTFCKNSKIHKVSKLQINPIEKSIIAFDVFKYPDTAIRRIRRFIKFLGLNIDFATIPRSRDGWEDCFSLWNDIKYSTRLNQPEEPVPTCRFFVEGVEIGTVSEFDGTYVTAIDLTVAEDLLG